MRFLPPILLHYYITERCNCRCQFCDIWEKPAKKKSDAILDNVLNNLRDAKKLGVKFVDFTGGEPLLHKNLPDMLQEAKRLGFRTSITTNCLRYVQRAEELAGLVDFLHFSLDGLSPEKHNAIRGRTAFEHVMASLDMARQLDESPDLLFTVSEDNIEHLAPLVEFAQALHLMLIINPVFAYSLFETTDLDVLEKIESCASSPFIYVNKAFHKLRRQGGNSTKAPRCRVMDSTIVIAPDNKLVMPCYHFQQQQVNLNGTDVASAQKLSIWKYYQKNQGRFDFCQGCHLNCYFDPSFHYKLDDYFWQSTIAKSRYWWDKNTRRRLAGKKANTRPAADIAAEIMDKYVRI